MEDESKYHLSISNLAFSKALKAGGIYILVFLLMKLVGLERVYQLRYLNTLLLFLFTMYTLNEINTKTKNHLEYLTGLAVSIFMAVISFSLFAFFMFFYLNFFDPVFMQYLMEHAPFGRYLNPINAAVWLIIEGIGIQISFTLIIMEYFKWRQYKLKSKQKLNK